MSYLSNYCRSKDTNAAPYSNLAIYDVIFAVKPRPQDLDLRNQTTPCVGESGHETTQVAPRATARVQNCVSGSYMEAIFELVANEESEIWTSLPHSFTKEGLLQLPG